MKEKRALVSSGSNTMWELVHVDKTGSDNGVCAKLLNVRRLTIGRVEADICISDKSVSRRHAVLEVLPSGNDFRFLLTDLSRFGTSVNGAALTDRQLELHSGDKITFGAQPGIALVLRQQAFNVAVSSMDRITKQTVKSLVAQLRGHLMNSLEECSFLIMPCLVVTAKVVCALLKLVPIVTPAYLEAYLNAASSIPFCQPNPDNYLPPLKEARLSAEDGFRFMPDPRRKTLLQQKVFYVLTEVQLSHLSQIVHLGQGKLCLFDSPQRCCEHHEAQFGVSSSDIASCLDRIIRHPSACVIHAQRVPAEVNAWQRTVYSALRRARRRPILESELGFAVVYSSTSGYCNPETKCPEKLYQEAGISQAFSINPFHMDSQPTNKRVLEERTDNVPVVSPPLKRPRELSVVVCPVAESSSPTQLCKTSTKRIRRCTKLIPPVRKVTPPAEKICLVPDSESSPKTRLSERKSLSVSSDSTCLAQDQPDGSFRSMAPGISTKDKIPSSPLVTCFVPLEFSPPDNRFSLPAPLSPDEEDALSALNRMSSLVNLRGSSSEAPVRQHRASPVPSQDAHFVDVDASQRQSCSESLGNLDTFALLSPSLNDAPSHLKLSQRLLSTEATPLQDSYTTDSAGWLAKKASFVPDINVTDPNSVPRLNVPVERRDLIVSTPAQLTRSCVNWTGTNFKVFKKVWPLHMQGNPETTHSEYTRRTNTLVALSVYQPNLTQLMEDYIPSGASQARQLSEQEERERVNRLFEQMCQLPKGRM
ncbi:unnamed protein product [Dicrocoelium dendriticum]|nr:unnamed protein product [Dicrocoelium dendriticum]